MSADKQNPQDMMNALLALVVIELALAKAQCDWNMVENCINRIDKLLRKEN